MVNVRKGVKFYEEKVKVHINNATTYTTAITHTAKLVELGYKLLSHSPYSSDLTL